MAGENRVAGFRARPLLSWCEVEAVLGGGGGGAWGLELAEELIALDLFCMAAVSS